jgi:hypothetical protein
MSKATNTDLYLSDPSLLHTLGVVAPSITMSRQHAVSARPHTSPIKVFTLHTFAHGSTRSSYGPMKPPYLAKAVSIHAGSLPRL